jgi:hypothetical protein
VATGDGIAIVGSTLVLIVEGGGPSKEVGERGTWGRSDCGIG